MFLVNPDQLSLLADYHADYLCVVCPERKKLITVVAPALT